MKRFFSLFMLVFLMGVGTGFSQWVPETTNVEPETLMYYQTSIDLYPYLSAAGNVYTADVDLYSISNSPAWSDIDKPQYGFTVGLEPGTVSIPAAPPGYLLQVKYIPIFEAESNSLDPPRF